MAYAFDKIRKVLGKDKPEEQGQANVFAPTDPAQAPQAPGNDRVQAASTAGDLGPAERSSPTSPTAPADEQNTTGAKNKIMQRNRGRVGAPIDVNGLTTSIKDAQTSIQGEADNYVKGADDRFEGGIEKDKSEIDYYTNKPAAGDEGGFNTQDPSYKPDEKPSDSWKDLYAAGTARQVDDIDLKTDTSFDDAQFLQNDAGLRELFRRGGDAEYNSGEAALDASLLGRDTGFNQAREGALRGERDLRKKENEIRQNARGQAQEAAETGYQRWKGEVDGELMSAIDQYRQKAIDSETSFDKGLTENIAGRDASLQAHLDKYGANTGIRGLNAGQLTDKERAMYLQNDVSADKTNWQDFVDGNSASNWSNILQLMGRGGPDLPVTGRYSGKDAKNFGTYDNKRVAKDLADRMKADVGAGRAAKPDATKDAKGNPIKMPDITGPFTSPGKTMGDTIEKSTLGKAVGKVGDVLNAGGSKKKKKPWQF